MSAPSILERAQFLWFLNRTAAFFRSEAAPHLICLLSDPHDRTQRLVSGQSMPRTERHSVVHRRRTSRAPGRLRLDRNACDALIGTALFRPDLRGVFNRHLVEVGTQLRAHFPSSSAITEKLHHRVSKPIRMAINV